MGYSQSPLRYPGGKSRFSRLLATFIQMNNVQDGIYVEPYAGGAGAGLNLLFSEYVDSIILNDADRMIYLFWKALLQDTEKFIDLINKTPVSIDERQRQKRIFLNDEVATITEQAFSTFYLNRCNRSGILNGGPIGGNSQTGEWRLDARFNKKELIRRIEKIADYRSRITIYNFDAVQFMRQIVSPLGTSGKRLLVYLDPPYYSKGDQLYLNYYDAAGHAALAEYIMKQTSFKWIVSYDDVPEIRELYSSMDVRKISLYYSAQIKRVGSEVIIFSPNSIAPDASQALVATA